MRTGRLQLGIRVVLAAVVVIAVGAVLAGGLGSHGSQDAPGVSMPVTRELAEPVPAVTGTTLHGEPFDIGELHGRFVVVNVLASWCAPCRRELPILAGAARRYADHDVAIIGLAMRDKADAALALLRDTGAEDLTVVADPDGTRAISLGVRGVPETFVIDGSGMLRLHAFGPISAEWLDRQLSHLGVT